MADIEKEVKSFNGTVVGNLTLDLDIGVVSGFSASNYLQLPSAFNPGNNNFEFGCKFTTGSNVSTDQGIFGSLGTSNGCTPFYIIGGNLVCFLSSNGSSWDIASAVVIMPLSTNTEYKLKAEFIGTAYNWYSYESETWVLKQTISSSSVIYGGLTPILGNNRGQSNPFLGSIDLSETYININGNLWWSPIKTDTYYGSAFKVHQTLPYMFGARGVGYYDSVISKVPTANEDILLTMKAYDGLTETYTEGVGTAGKVDFTGTILPWKWDYNSGLDVSKYCLMPSGLTYENIKTPDVLRRNFTVVGSLTINDSTGVVSGFSTGNYLTVPNSLGAIGNTFYYHFKTGSTPSNTIRLYTLESFDALLETSSRGLLVYSWSSRQFTTLMTVSDNTEYWIRVKTFTGQRSYAISTDGTTYGSETVIIDTTYGPQPSGTFYLGCYSNNEFWNGSLYLNDCYVTDSNGVEIWRSYVPAPYSLPGCTYNFADDGSAATLNAFAVQGDKNIVLTPDVEYYGNRYLGTVNIPQHDVYQYNNGTWQNAPYLIGGHTYYFKMIGGGGGSSTWEGGAGAYWEGYYTPAQTVAVVLSQGGGGSGAGAYSRNHNGVKGGTTSLVGEGVSIVCEGGQGAIGLREGDETGNSSTYTYAPTITITNGTYETIKASTRYRPRRISWDDDTLTGYGAGGQAAANTKAPGNDGLAGYLEYYQVGTITINPTPADALVEMSLDGIEYTTTSSLIAKVGEVVYYRVSKEGYIPEDTLVLVEGNETINVELTEEPQP